MSDPLLEVSGLHKVYADRKGREQIAVSDVSFTLAETESLAIVGESGSGKTTVAKIIVGLESATAGLITIAGAKLSATGRPSRTDRMRRAKLVQMVFQDPFLSLDPRQTVHAGLDELIVLHHGSEQRSRRIGELLEQVGLGEREARARPRDLSGGQRQRVAIARALVPEPRLLILDEAVAALDVSIQAQVLNVLRQIRSERGLSLLFITHDLSVVRHIAERTLVMHEGNVVDQGATTELLDAPSHPYTRLLVSSIPRPGWKPSRRAASKEPIV